MTEVAHDTPGTLHRFMIFLNCPTRLTERSDKYIRNLRALLVWIRMHPERSTTRPTAKTFEASQILPTKTMTGVYMDVTFEKPAADRERLMIHLERVRAIIAAAWETVQFDKDGEDELLPKVNVNMLKVTQKQRDRYMDGFESTSSEESSESEESDEDSD